MVEGWPATTGLGEKVSVTPGGGAGTVVKAMLAVLLPPGPLTVNTQLDGALTQVDVGSKASLPATAVTCPLAAYPPLAAEHWKLPALALALVHENVAVCPTTIGLGLICTLMVADAVVNGTVRATPRTSGTVLLCRAELSRPVIQLSPVVFAGRYWLVVTLV